MKHLLLILVFPLLLLTSCQEEVSESQLQPIEKCRNYTVDPCNPNNLYDTVGIIHNEGMDMLADTSLLDIVNGETFFKSKISELLYAHNLDDSDFLSNFNTLKVMADTLKQYSTNVQGFYSYLYNQ